MQYVITASYGGFSKEMDALLKAAVRGSRVRWDGSGSGFGGRDLVWMTSNRARAEKAVRALLRVKRGVRVMVEVWRDIDADDEPVWSYPDVVSFLDRALCNRDVGRPLLT